ncbi:MAG: type II toxin-antitoxin system PemK/MazF family toxin [Candidatus Bathyarchaeia archaeon]|jgi:mRNA interferase MazF
MQRAIKPMDIWMVSLTETVGSEQMGQRPAIVISVHNQSNTCMVVPLTKNSAASRFPYSFTIACSMVNGLSVDSVALIFQMRSLSMTAGRFLSKMGSVESGHFGRIKSLIKDYLQV